MVVTAGNGISLPALGLQYFSPELANRHHSLQRPSKGLWPALRDVLTLNLESICLACLGRLCPEEAAGDVQAQARLRLLLEPSYAVLEFELASALHCIINAHWERLLQNATFRPTVQVRNLQALGTLPPSATRCASWLLSEESPGTHTACISMRQWSFWALQHTLRPCMLSSNTAAFIMSGTQQTSLQSWVTAPVSDAYTLDFAKGRVEHGARHLRERLALCR